MSESRRRERQLRTLHRFLLLLLLHRPARFPLKLDDEGYATLDEVLRILKALPNFRWATRADVDAALALAGRQRIELVEDDECPARIRALDGHTPI